MLPESQDGGYAADEGSYRQQLQDVSGFAAERVLEAWEAYLLDHPNTAFRAQITQQMQAAELGLYGDELAPVQAVEGSLRGPAFPETALGENLNPALTDSTQAPG